MPPIMTPDAATTDAARFDTSLAGDVRRDWPEARLYEAALAFDPSPARIVQGGALLVETGQFTGRSPGDKFIVASPETEPRIWADNNQMMSRDAFDALLSDMQAHARGTTLYAQKLFAGADPAHRLNVEVVNEYPWHALFIRHLLRRPERAELESMAIDLQVVDLPSFKADPKRHGCRSETVIALDLDRGIVLIGGTAYAGEMKKSVFSVLNYHLPQRGVMPMHCSANASKADGTSDAAIFFGLSGTGKTTLSADPDRTLIGDDEHGWSDDGIFNFEGGCYAKTIRLSAEGEPEIWDAAHRFGSVLENVVVDEETRAPDFDDDFKTPNTRVAYPLEAIPNASPTGRADTPRNIVMLTCDSFGVLPPIARLDANQAMYHFLSGYTAKVAGTERGVTEPQATFSTCFGAPFMPLHPSVYGDLLRARIASSGAKCWLVNTGWTGGPYGVGNRMSLKITRTLLAAALEGRLDDAQMRTDPVFGLSVPLHVEGVDDAVLDPRRTWDDGAAFDAQAAKVAAMFAKNFAPFEAHVDEAVRRAGPKVGNVAGVGEPTQYQ